MQTIKLAIEGMHCGACATGIQMVVSLIDGVQSVTVDYDAKQGTVTFDPAKTNIDQILKAIAELQYKATVVQ